MDGYTANRAKGAPVSMVEGPVPLKDGALTMEVFIDRSLVEAFFNDDKSVSVRAYGKAASQGLSLFADGELRVLSLQVRTVSSIYR